MSSKATSDAKPEATAPGKRPGGKSAAGRTTPAANAAESAAVAMAGPDEPAGVTGPPQGKTIEVSEPAEAGETTETTDSPADPAASGEAGLAEDTDADAAEASREGEGDEGEGDEDEDEDVALVSLDDIEDYDLADRIELAELSEPVDDVPRRRWWPRLLIAFGFLLLAAVIVGAAIAIVGSVTHGFKKPVKVTYKKSAVFSLKTGECLDPNGQSYLLISCDSPHDAEVFATFTLAGTTWPGNTTVAAEASSGCASRLTGYLNPDLAISLASTYVYPDEVAWKAGTRTVICEVHAQSGQLTGSVRDAATAG